MVITKFATTTIFRPTKPIFDIFYIDFAFGNDFFSKLPFSVKFRRFLTKNPSYVEKSIILDSFYIEISIISSPPPQKNLRPLQSQRIKTYL
jgi:hypothetical protein